MRSRTAAKPAPPNPKPRLVAPPWLRPLVVCLLGVFVLCLLSIRVSDTDTWWHLTAGKYIWQNHRLPVPDPFSFTTDMGKPLYPGELITRHFNLTHEWGMQVIFYLVEAASGIGGLVLFRTLLLTFFAGITGWITWRRCGSFYRGIAAAFIAALFGSAFAADRPYLATFVMIALTVAAFETRRFLWLLPPAFLIWANLHGGFIMGWALAGAYAAEALYLRFRGTPLADERKIWTVTALAIFATVWNPNGLHVVDVMRHYRDSPLQISIYEWNYPAWWPPDQFNILEAGTAVVLLLARRRVRFVDWLLFAILGGSAATALRNVIFIGFIGPILIATYVPQWKRAVPAILEYATAAALAILIVLRIMSGAAFQLRAAEIFPDEAADFLLAHGFTGRIFNTYEQGGYLMWRLWPQVKVFIDGRALNESVANDYRRMQFNADTANGKTTNDLLRQYGVQAIVMNGFDLQGNLQFLAAALSDPSQKEWKLVFQDSKEFVYMRQVPPGVQALPSITALTTLEEQCRFGIEYRATTEKCARALGDMFLTIGDRARARHWLATYLLKDPTDPAALREFRRVSQ